MERSSNHVPYLRKLTLAFATVLLMTGVLNFLIDPYGVFSVPRVSGFNELKPAAAERVRVAKPYMAESKTAQTIIGGNSRAEIGLDPESKCLAPEFRPAFNMAIPGAGPGMQLDYVRKAVLSTGAARALIGVDFLDFLIKQSGLPSDPSPDTNFEPPSLGDGNEAFQGTARRLHDYFNSLFSLETLADSAMTVAQQGRSGVSTRTPGGFNPANDYIPIIRSEGQAVLFRQKNREIAGRLGEPNLGLYQSEAGRSHPLTELDNFLGWTRVNKIDVVVFINPYHAHYLALIDLSGKWSLLEQWKRDLLDVTSAQGVALWDFNAFNSFSTESPPTLGDTETVLEWFWEPAHYRKELGDLMIAALDGRPCPTARSQQEIGQKLTSSIIEPHLRKLREALSQYRDNHSAEYQALSGLASSVE